MKRIRTLAAFLLSAFSITVLVCLITPVHASSLPLQFQLDKSFPTKPNPDGTGPWLAATFDYGGTIKSVSLTMTANLSGSNKVTEWYLNLDPSFDPTELSFVLQGTPSAPAAGISTGADSFKSDGDGNFDIFFNFPTSGNVFDNTDSITYLITSTESIVASSFNFVSASGPSGNPPGEGVWHTAAHVQSISTDPGSTWVGDNDGLTEIPIPGAVWLLGSCLVGVVALRNRFKKH